MTDLMRAHEVPWPPPEGTSYEVADQYGTYVETVAPGAYEGTRVTRLPDPRSFIVAEDEWDVDHQHRTILKYKEVSRDG